jgi:hypothetical protein
VSNSGSLSGPTFVAPPVQADPLLDLDPLESVQPEPQYQAEPEPCRTADRFQVLTAVQVAARADAQAQRSRVDAALVAVDPVQADPLLDLDPLESVQPEPQYQAEPEPQSEVITPPECAATCSTSTASFGFSAGALASGAGAVITSDSSLAK